MGVPVGDKIESIYKDPGFRESVVFTAKLMREKLMTQDANTQTEDQVREKAMNGKFAVIATFDPMKMLAEADAELKKKDPEDGYMFIQPIAKEGLDRSKIYPGTYNQLGWNVAVITKNAKNPEAVFALLDWMTGPEGSMVLNWGPPGPDGYWNGFEEDGVTPKFNMDKYLDDPDTLAEISGKAGDLVWVGNTMFLDNTRRRYCPTCRRIKSTSATVGKWRLHGARKAISPSSSVGNRFRRAKSALLDRASEISG